MLTRNAANQHEILEEEIYITKDGYMETFVVNETSEDVWFDNMMVTSLSSTIVQETHYDPWGLEQKGLGYQYGGIKENKYLYNGKELIEDNGLQYYDYGARMYDPAIGRWGVVDPLAEQDRKSSPNSYAFNNPLRFIDPDGRFSTDVVENKDGTYTLVGGDANDGDKNIYIVSQNKGGGYTRGKSIGESLTTHSFFDDQGNAVVGATINPNSTEGQDFLDDEIIGANPTLAEYMPNATGGQVLDFKTRGIDQREAGTTLTQHMYRGSKAKDGSFGSARDFGNMGAGIVAARKGLSWSFSRLGFDTLQSIQEGGFATEGTPTQLAQNIGFRLGQLLNEFDSESKGGIKRLTKNDWLRIKN